MKTGPSIQSRVKIKDDMSELMGIFSWQVHKGVHTMERWNKRNYWILIIHNYILLSNCRKHVSYSVDRYTKARIPWNVKTWSRTHLTMEASKQVFLWHDVICNFSIFSPCWYFLFRFVIVRYVSAIFSHIQNHLLFFFISCPGQLNNWHCLSLGRSVPWSEPTNNQSLGSIKEWP